MAKHSSSFSYNRVCLACNTAFEHPSRHKTTWTGWIPHPSTPSTSIPVYNQIDYILCKTTSKCLLTDARSYGGATLSSDYKLVLARLQFSFLPLVWKRPSRQSNFKFNVQQLCIDLSVQDRYNIDLSQRMKKLPPTNDPNTALSRMLTCIHQSAKATIGIAEPFKGSNYVQDNIVATLSQNQKQLRLQIESSTNTTSQRALHKQRTDILRQINHRLREIASERADRLVEDINSTDESRKMFKAVKSIKSAKRTPPLTVHTPEGKCIGSNQGKADSIKYWFQQMFSDPSHDHLESFTGNPRPLKTPITSSETEAVLHSLKNGRAAGPDNISNELLKYASESISMYLSNVINMMFEQHLTLDSLGKGTLIALSKPKKPVVPFSSLRPIVLLNCTRKVVSLITLHRIQKKVNAFTSTAQAGFKQGRSCADVVWAQRMLISVVLCRKWEFHKMGIDMSRAFDMINRTKLLEVLNMVGCNEDELHLIQVILASTQLSVRVKNTHSASFATTIGSPQDDSLSPVLFTCYLEAALREVRSNISWLNPPDPHKTMPLEWEYADDVDFANEEQPPLKALLPVIHNTLEEWNLKVNESKTEFIHIHLDNPAGEESWRTSKSLGSFLCSKADLTHRCILGTAAFRSLWAMWMRRPLLTLEKRLLIYHTIIVPIMLYNCDSWAVPKTSLDQLDKCHSDNIYNPSLAFSGLTPSVTAACTPDVILNLCPS